MAKPLYPAQPYSAHSVNSLTKNNSSSVAASLKIVLGAVIFAAGLANPLTARAQSTTALAPQPVHIAVGGIRATPTPESILAEINRVRLSPAEYAVWLASLRPYYQGAALRFPGERGVRTVEGVNALDSAIATLSRTAPLQPLSLAPGLALATQAHLGELLENDRFTLSGLDGSTPLERAERYGSIGGGRLVESLSQGFTRAEMLVAFWVMDDGDARRTARSLVLNPEMTQFGTACGSAPGVAPLCVFDYATAYRSAEGSVENSQAVAREVVVSEPTAPADTSEVTWSGAVSAEQLAGLSQELIGEINRLRADPAAYAQGLIRLRPYYEGNLVKVPGQPIVAVQEGIAALDEAIAALQSAQPLATLSPSVGMAQGAADHSDDLGFKGLTGHYGSDGSDPFVRINRYGSWAQSAGENITYGAPTSAEWHMIQLLVDDGVPSRGHRETLLNPAYRRVGAACSPHATYRIVCVMTHAGDYVEGQ